ncbi:hypothetical protein CMV_024623 [Castanea mollissima]|uniref:Uncharacterized protein n=1 Tax=Castanea mollissima TaxID=60419 RepID=A0A8J4QMU8_9ROSI|nr:hypothetical protein CMV_024623 [Castanea mollissima]
MRTISNLLSEQGGDSTKYSRYEDRDRRNSVTSIIRIKHRSMKDSAAENQEDSAAKNQDSAAENAAENQEENIPRSPKL